MWVARERNGSLYLFNRRPWKPSAIVIQSLPFGLEGHWFPSDSKQMIRIDDSLFPELTYDDEPLEIELKLK